MIFKYKGSPVSDETMLVEDPNMYDGWIVKLNPDNLGELRDFHVTERMSGDEKMKYLSTILEGMGLELEDVLNL